MGTDVVSAGLKLSPLGRLDTYGIIKVMASETIELVMSGRCYVQAVSGSSVPSEEHWPEPTVRRVGRGRQYIYRVNAATAELIVSHVRDLYDSWNGYEEAAQDRADLRRFVRRYESMVAP